MEWEWFGGRPDVWTRVQERDNWTCQVTGKPGTDIHHIVPRGWGGKRWRERCDEERNLICLDHTWHLQYAHTRWARRKLLTLLQRRHGYDYSDEPYTSALAPDNIGENEKQQTWAERPDSHTEQAKAGGTQQSD